MEDRRARCGLDGVLTGDFGETGQVLGLHRSRRVLEAGELGVHRCRCSLLLGELRLDVGRGLLRRFVRGLRFGGQLGPLGLGDRSRRGQRGGRVLIELCLLEDPLG